MLTAIIILTICALIAFTIAPHKQAKKRNTGHNRTILARKPDYYQCQITGLNGISKTVVLNKNS